MSFLCGSVVLPVSLYIHPSDYLTSHYIKSDQVCFVIVQCEAITKYVLFSPKYTLKTPPTYHLVENHEHQPRSADQAYTAQETPVRADLSRPTIAILSEASSI